MATVTRYAILITALSMAEAIDSSDAHGFDFCEHYDGIIYEVGCFGDAFDKYGYLTEEAARADAAAHGLTKCFIERHECYP